ncbi:MAG: VOC family protein [Actinomycetota bacterium]|nr:VOC family protein [Acidimicrobiia bacterium]MDQ3146040.1 VOC family protein [Actinomycetota bacterium]
MVRVEAMDHIVLRVSDPERSLRWYCDELGLRPERVEEWRRGETLFPSVRVDSGTIIDLLLVTPGGGHNLDHFCLVVQPTDLQAVATSGRFDVVEGPTEPRSGARGMATALYVRDPDDNVVELRHYG